MKRPPRFAKAGRCTSCGVRTVRGFDDTGTVVEVEIWPIDEPTEWAEFNAGRSTFVLSWSGMGMTVTRRSEHDMKLNPPGYTHGTRVVPIHRCEGNR